MTSPGVRCDRLMSRLCSNPIVICLPCSKTLYDVFQPSAVTGAFVVTTNRQRAVPILGNCLLRSRLRLPVRLTRHQMRRAQDNAIQSLLEAKLAGGYSYLAANVVNHPSTSWIHAQIGALRVNVCLDEMKRSLNTCNVEASTI